MSGAERIWSRSYVRLVSIRVEVRPVTGQIDDLVGEINARAARNERVL